MKNSSSDVVTDRIPYAYLITNKLNGKRYYGISFRKGCNPSEIGVTYKSSSKLLKSEYELYGLANFSFEVRRTFNSIKKCQRWERRVLTMLDAANNDNWYNQSNGADGFYTKTQLSAEHRRKIGDKHKGRIVTSETRAKQSKAQTGHKQSKSHIDKRVLKNTGQARSESAILATAEKNRGRKNTEESIALMSKNRTGINKGVPRSRDAVLKGLITRRSKMKFIVSKDDVLIKIIDGNEFDQTGMTFNKRVDIYRHDGLTYIRIRKS